MVLTLIMLLAGIYAVIILRLGMLTVQQCDHDLFNVTESDDGNTHLALKADKMNVIEEGYRILFSVLKVVPSRKRTIQALLVRKLSGYLSRHPILQVY